MKRALLIGAVLFPFVACASDASGDLLGGLVSVVTNNPKVVGVMAILTGIQHAAPWLAMIPGIWGGNTADTGAGSGWSRFWRKVEGFGIDKLIPIPK